MSAMSNKHSQRKFRGAARCIPYVAYSTQALQELLAALLGIRNLARPARCGHQSRLNYRQFAVIFDVEGTLVDSTARDRPQA